jgi:uncharacterized membrane protein YfcA
MVRLWRGMVGKARCRSMNPADSHLLLYSLSGLGVGMLVGMTGVGGGSLMTPLLILLFGIHPATAVGTDLLYAAVTKTAGTAFHGFRKTVDWRITGRLATGSIPATLLTIVAMRQATDRHFDFGPILAPLLAACLVLTAVCLLLRERILAFAAGRVPQPPEVTVTTLTIVSGVVLGILVSLTSVGAGALGMTALVFLYPKHATVRLVGSDIAHAVPLTLIAGMGHWYLGSINLPLLGMLLIGSLPGILIGSFIAGYLPGKVLRTILAVTLLLVARQLVR